MSSSLPQARAAAEPPSFVVGRDAGGRWLAVETHGLGGGVFTTRDDALHYARDETCRRPGAVAVIDEVGAEPGSLPDDRALEMPSLFVQTRARGAVAPQTAAATPAPFLRAVA